MNVTPDIIEKVKKLEEKYKNCGQDLGSYLDGLLHEKYLTYWDYIHLDTLLSLQTPRTHFPDEEIFITYHQITELYFKLIIHEQKQVVDDTTSSTEFFIQKITRINNYFKILVASFETMITGMDRQQFMQFRMALLPASGFQSAQYRLIELYATPLHNLVHTTIREALTSETDLEKLYENSYWKRGATNVTTGEKTLTLKQFEHHYTARFLRIAHQLQNNTIYHKYQQLPSSQKQNPRTPQRLRRCFKIQLA